MLQMLGEGRLSAALVFNGLNLLLNPELQCTLGSTLPLSYILNHVLHLINEE